MLGHGRLNPLGGPLLVTLASPPSCVWSISASFAQSESYWEICHNEVEFHSARHLLEDLSYGEEIKLLKKEEPCNRFRMMMLARLCSVVTLNHQGSTSRSGEPDLLLDAFEVMNVFEGSAIRVRQFCTFPDGHRIRLPTPCVSLPSCRIETNPEAEMSHEDH